MPARVWHDVIEEHFPGSAWLRCGRQTLDALAEFKSAYALPTWDATLSALLAAASMPRDPSAYAYAMAGAPQWRDAAPEPTYAATEIVAPEPQAAATEVTEPEPQAAATEVTEPEPATAATEVTESGPQFLAPERAVAAPEPAVGPNRRSPPPTRGRRPRTRGWSTGTERLKHPNRLTPRLTTPHRHQRMPRRGSGTPRQNRRTPRQRSPDRRSQHRRSRRQRGGHRHGGTPTTARTVRASTVGDGPSGGGTGETPHQHRTTPHRNRRAPHSGTAHRRRPRRRNAVSLVRLRGGMSMRPVTRCLMRRTAVRSHRMKKKIWP